MRIAEYRMRTPVTFIWATTGGNHVDAAHSMFLAPHIDIAFLIYLDPVRPWDRVQISDLDALGGRHDRSILVAKRHACHSMQPVRPVRSERRQQFSHGGFALADHHHVCAEG